LEDDLRPLFILFTLLLTVDASAADAIESLSEDPRLPDADPPPSTTQGRAAIYDRVSPAVVQIKTHDGNGSGFFVRDGQTIVTAWHVLKDHNDFLVETRSGEQLSATLVDFDKDADLAILRLERPVEASVLELADQEPRVGQSAYAVGNPLLVGEESRGKRKGLLAWSFTEGMVSAVNDDMVQITTSVQPGNSGGPVVDENGCVLGVAVERYGDFGFAARFDALEALLDRDEPAKRLPPVDFGVGFGMRLDGMPGQPEHRQLRFGLDLNVDMVIDRKLMIGVGSTLSFLGNDDQRKGVNPERRMDLYGRVGPSFDLPKRPTGAGYISLQPYFLAGTTLTESGTRTSSLQLSDPDCDPSQQLCETQSTTDLTWDPTWAPLVGGGVRAVIGMTTIGFEAAVNPLNPTEDVRAGLTFGIRF
jgi:hypothetical protein